MANLTRKGARNLTAALDLIANTIQKNPELLGIDNRIAKDFALRCDLLSDVVEKRAVQNYPLNRKAGVDETGLSVDFSNGGFDANAIGDVVPGPLEIIEPPSEPWMDDHFTQENFMELGEMEQSGELAAAAAQVNKLAAQLRAAKSAFAAKSAKPKKTAGINLFE